MAGELGFEPSLADPESAVLPLDYSPANQPSFDIITKIWQWFKGGDQVVGLQALLLSASRPKRLTLTCLGPMLGVYGS